jgi:hypothetical protein
VGAGPLAEAAVRLPLLRLLPISVMVAVSEAMTIVTFAGLIRWTRLVSPRRLTLIPYRIRCHHFQRFRCSRQL